MHFFKRLKRKEPRFFVQTGSSLGLSYWVCPWDSGSPPRVAAAQEPWAGSPYRSGPSEASAVARKSHQFLAAVGSPGLASAQSPLPGLAAAPLPGLAAAPALLPQEGDWPPLLLSYRLGCPRPCPEVGDTGRSSTYGVSASASAPGTNYTYKNKNTNHQRLKVTGLGFYTEQSSSGGWLGGILIHGLLLDCEFI